MRASSIARPLLLLAAVGSPGACGSRDDDRNDVLRVGHFPNVTHAHGVIGHHLTRAGKGWFEERLGPGIRVEWLVFDAGPSAMESLLTGSIDLAYVGPNPALNAHIRSRGEEVRVVAGATRGGAGLVVQGDGRIGGPRDFKGRRVGTPQFGNTQDVACRVWLLDQGFRVTQTGGDVLVVPTSNPDQLPLFRERELDAVWTVEPWLSRLELDAGGRLYVEETEAVTTVLVARTRFLARRRDLARRFVAAHAELTEWIRGHPAEAKEALRAELLEETRSPLPERLLDHAWLRLVFDAEVPLAAFQEFQRSAVRTGFLQREFPLDRFVEEP
ncbi:MAG: ABC transporter substrate-binding protein [Planctomycetota bacterium]